MILFVCVAKHRVWSQCLLFASSLSIEWSAHERKNGFVTRTFLLIQELGSVFEFLSVTLKVS